MSVNDNKAYPLQWPAGWERTSFRSSSKFNDRLTIFRATKAVEDEVRRLGGTKCIISTNLRLRLDGAPISDQRAPDDPGAAAYFDYKGKPRVFACDRWNKVQHNLWAIARHIENIRASERWGVGDLDRAFSGYDALPAPKPDEWWSILDVERDASSDFITRTYRNLAKEFHPDNQTTGNAEKFVVINGAYEAAKLEKGFA